MIKLRLQSAKDGVLRILCLGAHSDDIEIGCSGTLLKLLDAHPTVLIKWVVLSGDHARASEASASANSLLTDATQTELVFGSFEDGYFPHQGAQIKRFFEEKVKADFSPDLIFTHFGGDRHQDHRLVSELTWNTFRDHLVLEYEIIKYDGDLGHPQVFVELDKDTCQRKVENLMASFPSQSVKRWFNVDTFWGLMAVRGVEAAAASGFAEAFHARKIVL